MGRGKDQENAKFYSREMCIRDRCRLTNTEQYSRINKDTIADKVSDTTISNNKQITRNSSTEDNQTEEFRKQSLNGFEKATLYKLTDTIMSDFNGDGFLDKAVYKKENETSGRIIIDV